jgi:hypothetical protein
MEDIFFHKIAGLAMNSKDTDAPWQDESVIGRTIHTARHTTDGNTIAAAAKVLVSDSAYTNGHEDLWAVGAIIEVAKMADKVLNTDPSHSVNIDYM